MYNAVIESSERVVDSVVGDVRDVDWRGLSNGNPNRLPAML